MMKVMGSGPQLRVLVFGTLLGLAGCMAEMPSGEIEGAGVEGDVGVNSQAYKVAPWGDSRWNLYTFVAERAIRVCPIREAGTTLSDEALRWNILFAVFDWINSVQSSSTVPLFVNPVFDCQDLDGVPLYDIAVILHPGNGRAWNHGTHIDLYEAEPRLYETLLHEFGHSFGMDDTYVESGGCQPNQPPSVMCNATFTSLQTDDLRGARQAFRIVQPYTYTGPRTLEGSGSGRCIDVVGFGTGNGSGIQIWDCSPGPTTNQVWTYDPYAQSFVGEDSGRCLDVAGGGTANGTPVHLWDCHGGPNQRWELWGDGTVRSVASGKCLDVSGAGTGNGSAVQIWDCHGGSNQIWWWL